MERDLHPRLLHKCEISFRNISDRMKVKTEADYFTTKRGSRQEQELAVDGP